MKAALRQYWLTALKTVIAAAVLVYLLRADWLNVAQIAALLAIPEVLSLVMLTMLVCALGGALRWHVLLEALTLHGRLGNRILPNYIGMSISPVLPGGFGGDIVRFTYLLRHFQHARTKALTSILMDRLLGFLSLGVLVAGIAVLYARSIASMLQEALPTFQRADEEMLIGIAALTLLLCFNRRRLLHTLTRLLHCFPPLFKACEELKHSVQLYSRSGRKVLFALGLSIAMQLLIAVAIWQVAQYSGFTGLAFWEIILASALAQIAALLPLTPGGIGIAEGGFAMVLLLLHPGEVQAYSSIYLTYRIISLLFMVPGMLLYFTRRDY